VGELERKVSTIKIDEFRNEIDAIKEKVSKKAKREQRLTIAFIISHLIEDWSLEEKLGILEVTKEIVWLPYWFKIETEDRNWDARYV